MLRSVRYQNPIIRDHLASQYAMGLLTPLVKRRVEKLMLQDMSFEKEVIEWQERLAPLNDIPPAIEPPVNLKAKILNQIGGPSIDSSTGSRAHWWQRLWLWQGAAFASLVVAVLISIQPLLEAPVGGQLSYVAVMSSPLASDEAPLVISAYAKTEDAPSRLEIHKNDRQTLPDLAGTTLWSIERETGAKVALLTLEQDVNSINLNANQWQAVKGSLELVIIKGSQFDGEVVMRGICLQLANWQS